MDTRRWRAKTDGFERESPASLILLPARGPGVTLNAPAAAIWACTRRPRTTDEVTAEVAARFGEEPTAVRPFVIETLEQLAAAGLLETDAGSLP